MKTGNPCCAGVLILVSALAGCGGGDTPDTDKTIDVTAGNAANIVDDTARKVDASIEQNTRALDAAIEAQSKGAASE